MWKVIDNSSNGADIQCIVSIKDQADVEWEQICSSSAAFDFWNDPNEDIYDVRYL